MSRTATINTRVDPTTKLMAKRVLGALDISMSEAISMYLKHIVLQKGIPFDIKIPNQVTAKAIEQLEAGDGVKTVSSHEELFDELGI